MPINKQKKEKAQSLVTAIARVMIALDRTSEIVGEFLNEHEFDSAAANEAYNEARAALYNLDRLIKKQD